MCTNDILIHKNLLFTISSVKKAISLGGELSGFGGKMVNKIFDRIKKAAYSVVGHSSLIDKKKIVYEKNGTKNNNNQKEIKVSLDKNKNNEKLPSFNLNKNLNNSSNFKENENKKDENESGDGDTLNMWDLNKLFLCVGSKSCTYNQAENREILQGNYTMIVLFWILNCCIIPYKDVVTFAVLYPCFIFTFSYIFSFFTFFCVLFHNT